MKLRQADERDLPGIMRLEAECFGPERFNVGIVKAFLGREDAFIVVAEADAELVGSGMCVFSTGSAEGRIASIAVLPGHRRKGLGERLLDECERGMIARGIRVLALEVATDNGPATRLYLSKGYEIKGTIKDYYSKGRDAHFMVRTVPGKRKVRVRPS